LRLFTGIEDIYAYGRVEAVIVASTAAQISLLLKSRSLRRVFGVLGEP
jgi:hypothetical protein